MRHFYLFFSFFYVKIVPFFTKFVPFSLFSNGFLDFFQLKMDEDIKTSYGQKGATASSVKASATTYIRGNSRIKRQLSVNKTAGASAAQHETGVAAV